MLINSWHFDFENMIARRSKTWPHYDPANIMSNYRLLIAVDSEIKIKRKDRLEEFFCEPEDNYNEAINRAYLDYLFEKQILV